MSSLEIEFSDLILFVMAQTWELRSIASLMGDILTRGGVGLVGHLGSRCVIQGVFIAVTFGKPAVRSR